MLRGKRDDTKKEFPRKKSTQRKSILIPNPPHKAMRQEDQFRFKKLTNEARADWITIGLLAGMILAAVLSQLPWWGALIALTAIIGSVQGVSRYGVSLAQFSGPCSSRRGS